MITEKQKNKATNESAADSTVSCSTVEFRLTVKKGVSFSIFTIAVIVVKGKGAGGTKSKGLPYHINFLHRFA